MSDGRVYLKDVMAEVSACDRVCACCRKQERCSAPLASETEKARDKKTCHSCLTVDERTNMEQTNREGNLDPRVLGESES